MNSRFLTGVLGGFVLGTLICLSGCQMHENKNKKERIIPVKTVVVAQQYDSNRNSYVGTIEEESAATLSFSVAGQVQQIFVGEGDKVQQGQLLATLDRSVLQHTYDVARSTLNRAQDVYDRMEKLHEQNSLPDMKWVEVQSALQQAISMERIAFKNLQDTELRAPFSGIVSRKNIELGNNVVPGVTAFTLMKTFAVNVKIAIPENEISHVNKGDKVAIRVAALNDRIIQGKITEKGIAAHSLSHTYDARIKLDNRDGALLPGMVCNVSLMPDSTVMSFIVPNMAVFTERDRYFVWLAENGSAVKRYVRIDGFSANGIAVSDGIKSGDRIIVEGCQKISEGMKITEQ